MERLTFWVYLLSIMDKCLEINEIVRTAQVKLIIQSDIYLLIANKKIGIVLATSSTHVRLLYRA